MNSLMLSGLLALSLISCKQQTAAPTSGDYKTLTVTTTDRTTHSSYSASIQGKQDVKHRAAHTAYHGRGRGDGDGQRLRHAYLAETGRDGIIRSGAGRYSDRARRTKHRGIYGNAR